MVAAWVGVVPSPVTEHPMRTTLYPVVAEWDDAARAWSLLSPDFLEVASAATSRERVWQQADDAIRTAIEARREDGEAVPPPMAEPWLLTAD